MVDVKKILERRVTACKKFIEGGDVSLTKRLDRVKGTKVQGAAAQEAFTKAVKEGLKTQ